MGHVFLSYFCLEWEVERKRERESVYLIDYPRQVVFFLYCHLRLSILCHMYFRLIRCQLKGNGRPSKTSISLFATTKEKTQKQTLWDHQTIHSFFFTTHSPNSTQTMTPINKRPAESASVKDGPAKRTASTSAPVKQQSLLSWAKAKAPTPKDGEASKDGIAAVDVVASSSMTTVVPKARPDILKLVKEELRELLQLEQDTVDATWLRVLQTEFTKPYFLEVRKETSCSHDNVAERLLHND